MIIRGKFMKKRNLFLILLTLSGIITAFTIVATNTVNTKNMRDLAIKSSSLTASVIEDEELVPTESQKPELTDEITVNEASPAPTQTPEPELKFIPPVKGDIITQFGEDVLVFSEVYNDYRIHPAVDIIADNNEPVFAMADGVVVNNYFDYDEGIVIEIEHRDGYVSIYKNLGNAVMAPIGKIVKQGETVSSIGDTGVFESNMPYHLHLEMKKNNEYIDPLNLVEE